MTDERIRILIADDHALVREGLRHVLNEGAGFHIVAEAGGGHEALKLAQEHQPDVILLDITMPEGSGFEAAAQLRRAVPEARLLFLSIHDHVQYVVEAVRAGANGYLLKDATPAELRDAVRAVHAGDSFFTARIAKQLTDALRGTLDRNQRQATLDLLTGRELEVLRGIAEGRTNREIAGDLGISRRTVESHRESLMRKLRIRTVAGLTRFALESGLLAERVSADE
jgi:DNA-binding NarL/FixJ family response regulator